MRYTLLFLFVCISLQAFTQIPNNTYVDDRGIMRWGANDEEVHGFGVNYSVPFAHAYRTAERMGIDPKEAIDNDVYHFSRLGFDLYRIHVWDTEISDTLGNLLENKHLDAFDYLLKKLSDHNINYVITAIAYWGSGWPEPDPESPGFSYKYGKGECLTNENCIKAQENYLTQFMNHVNPYTGKAYKNDPNLIAIEISNEPHHREEPEVVTEFVSKMVNAVRKSGTDKPIFYNASHAVHLNDAYFKAGIDGGTFQWYPTGLGYQQELSGNLLPNVDNYNIPFDDVIKSYQGAKLVYEFDAADVGRSYIYPAMARSFREAGIQLATHFAYDPTYMAHTNTEYNTHYMNLAYTPQKALALMITSKVFHEIPMNKDFGVYPENKTFGNFSVSYKQDLAEYNAESTFIYTNNTNTAPVNKKKLTKVAGYGNSPVVKYDGTGAYFLDMINKNTWRLEVMPDAAWVDNPFGRNSPDKIVGVIKWEERNMTLNLEGLGSKLQVVGINEGNTYMPNVDGNTFSIKPGTYIVSSEGARKKWSASDDFGTNKLNDFYAPQPTTDQLWVRHKPLYEVTSGYDLKIQAQVIGPEKPEEVQLVGYSNNGRIFQALKNEDGYNYLTTIPADKLTEGYLYYYLVIKMDEDEYISYPAGMEGRPFDWDFYDREPYKVRVVPSVYPIYLFDAASESDLLVRQWRRGVGEVPTNNYKEAEYQVRLEKLFIPDNENLNAEPVYDYSMKHFVMDNIKGRRPDLSKKQKLIIRGRSLTGRDQNVQIAFVTEDGAAYGKVVEMDNEVKDYQVSLDELEPVKTVTLPRPYPTFLPYYLEHDINDSFDINKIESIQISIGPGIESSELEQPHGIGIRRIWLE